MGVAWTGGVILGHKLRPGMSNGTGRSRRYDAMWHRVLSSEESAAALQELEDLVR